MSQAALDNSTYHSPFNKKITTSLYVIFILLMLSSCNVTKPTNNLITPIKDTTKTTDVYIINPLDTELTLFLNDSIFANAHVGVCVYEPAKNTYLYSYQANKYFIPASNVKIATCYAAMKYLGDSLVGLKYDENDSAIFIQPTGDPTFLHQDFTTQKIFNWLQSTKKKIYLSDAKFLAYPLGKGWAWDDYEEPYMAERSPLPMYGNTVKFYYNSGYKTTPHFFEKLINKGFEASNGDTRFKVSRKLGENVFAINPGKKDTNEITFNTQQSVNEMTDLLSDVLYKKVVRANHITTKKIYSQPTDSLLKPMMHNSDNFFAEQSLLMVSNEKLGLMSDEKIIDTLLKTDFIALPQKPKWVDGSGLSRHNLFSPQDFVFILNKMKNELSWQRISTIFPTGNEGTLKGYYKKYQNKIFAKTGSLSNNLALSGFIKTNKDKEFVFSIIINNHQTSASNVRLNIEKFLSAIIEQK